MAWVNRGATGLLAEEPAERARNGLRHRKTHEGERSTESLLIITGTMGVGKSTVLAEASDLLAQRRIVHAAVDLDGMAMGYLPSGAANDALMYGNLRALWNNFRAAGVGRLMVARAVEDRERLEMIREVVAADRTTVCRLVTSRGEAERRVWAREPGLQQQKLVERVAVLDAILDHARIEDFTIVNEQRCVTETALEMLLRAGWTSSVTGG